MGRLGRRKFVHGAACAADPDAPGEHLGEIRQNPARWNHGHRKDRGEPHAVHPTREDSLAPPIRMRGPAVQRSACRHDILSVFRRCDHDTPNAKGPRPGHRSGWGPAGQLHEIYVANVRAAMPSRRREHHAEFEE